jgi:hypothetical protein
MKLVRVAAIAVACLSAAAGASAQTPYVGASLFGDIVRTTYAETAGARGASGGGEALGFALRVGTRVGAIWGVEAEFARPQSIEEEGAPGGIPIPALQTSLAFELAPVGSTLIYPPIIVGFRSSQRHTTLSAVAWAEQVLSARVSLVYLGGVGFVRSQHEYSASYSPILRASPTILPPYPSYASETVMYGAGVLAGFEARLGLTDRAQLVPGIRMHAIGDTWLVRPSVGITWNF